MQLGTRRRLRRRKLLNKGNVQKPRVEVHDSIVVLKGVKIPEDGAIPVRGLTSNLAGQDVSGALSDEQLVELWLNTGERNSPHTQKAYRRDVEDFRQHLARFGRTLRTARVRDVQQWATALVGAPKTRSRRIGAIRSLLSFGEETGYLVVNVGRVVKPPKIQNDLAERILTELEVQKLFAACRGGTLRIVGFLYATGARIEEACKFCWKHLHQSPDGSAVATLHGKRAKTRHVPIARSVAAELKEFRGDAKEDDFVFRSKKGKRLHPVNVTKAIRRAAKRAGIQRPVSAHWLRHAHASHALDHGAPVHVVQQSLGHVSLATTGMYTHVRPGDGSGLYLSLLK
jgi:integrase/recombinase XerD